MEAEKQRIIDEIRRTAKDNGGKPLGKEMFTKETAITMYDVFKFFPTYSDAIIEAGFKPNSMKTAHSVEVVAQGLIVLIRKHGRFPTHNEMALARYENGNFPCIRKYAKGRLLDIVLEYSDDKEEYRDVYRICKESVTQANDDIVSKEQCEIREVYLYKSGRYYKIGKTSDMVRRGKEIRIQLPEKLVLIHSIQTDDPSGIEAYWHKRFEGKRKEGEWFDLNSSDIRAFKRWRKIV